MKEIRGFAYLLSGFYYTSCAKIGRYKKNGLPHEVRKAARWGESGVSACDFFGEETRARSSDLARVEKAVVVFTSLTDILRRWWR